MTVTLDGIETIGKLAANSGVDIGDVDVLTVNGVAPQFDDTDKLAVSLYGKASAGGDSPLLVEGAGTTANLRVSLFDATSQMVLARWLGDGDGQTGNHYGLVAVAQNALFDGGSAYDRQRNNVQATLLASAARTATANSADQTNYNNNRGLLLFFDVSSITDTPSVTPQLDFKDPISGDYEPLWIASTAVTATGEYIYMFALGGSGSAGEYDEAVNVLIPRTWRLTMTHADADSITYSVAGVLLC